LDAADLRAVKLWAVSIMKDNCEVHGYCFEESGRRPVAGNRVEDGGIRVVENKQNHANVLARSDNKQYWSPNYCDASVRCVRRRQKVRLGRECGASITWMAAGEASICICSLLGLAMACVLRVGFGGFGWIWLDGVDYQAGSVAERGV
jgi:hypothetical protein